MRIRMLTTTAVAAAALAAPAADAYVVQGPPSTGPVATHTTPATVVTTTSSDSWNWGDTALGTTAGLLVAAGLLASTRGRIQRSRRSLRTS
jgi:hypothetical protein